MSSFNQGGIGLLAFHWYAFPVSHGAAGFGFALRLAMPSPPLSCGYGLSHGLDNVHVLLITEATLQPPPEGGGVTA